MEKKNRYAKKLIFISLFLCLGAFLVLTSFIIKENQAEKELKKLKENNVTNETIAKLELELKQAEQQKQGIEDEILKTNPITKTEIDSLKKSMEENKKTVEDLRKLAEITTNTLHEKQQQHQQLIKSSSVYLSKVPAIWQFPDYPTGCESIALLTILRYYKVNVTAEDLVNALKKGEAPHMEGNTQYGGNPEIEFLGDPRDKDSYGVYQKPIQQVANQFKPGMKDITGSSLDQVLEKVASGNPVQVWVSLNISRMYISNQWIYKPTGQLIRWPAGFHSMVVVGYTPYEVIVSDPDTGTIRYFERSKFEMVYNYFGKRALYYEG